MGCQQDPLVQAVCELYEKISSLESLKPCKDVNMLMTQLVLTCMPPNYPIDVTKLCRKVQEMRSNLIQLCGEAEGHLESHYSSILASYDNPIDHLHIFPYFANYLKLSQLEFNMLSQHHSGREPSRVAFVGSGPLPLSSIILASHHLTKTHFDNYDMDPSANSKALQLVSPDPDLSKRMVFHTTDIMDVTCALRDYDVIFLAALVGMEKEQKIRVIEHLAKYMANGSILILRSVRGARGFLYPVVEDSDLRGFQVLSVFHPTDEVINSVIIARKCSALNHEKGSPLGPIMMPSKCCEIHQVFDPLNHGCIVEELTIEEKSS